MDIGSGAGMDALITSKLVGPGGRVAGIDMTREMRQKASNEARQMGADNVEFMDGLVEDLPLPHGFADVVISNGVLNLTLDKVATLHFRLPISCKKPRTTSCMWSC